MTYIMTEVYTTDLRKKTTDPSRSAKTRAIVLRLLEVAVVCICTSLVVVLLPLSPGVDTCSLPDKPVEHVKSLLPNVCTESLKSGSKVDFTDCLNSLRLVCMPYDIKSEYVQVRFIEKKNFEKVVGC
jgi:hypothetical protein